MVKFGRRQRNREQESEPPIFSDAHSMSGTSNGGTVSTFSARIIVSDGTTNTCTTEVVDTALDTTIGLEQDLSINSSGEGNELVIITNTVDDPDLEEAALERTPIDTSSKEKAADTKKTRACMVALLFVFTIGVILVIALAATNKLGGDDSKNRLEADASTGVFTTMAPSTFDPSEATATMDPTGEDIQAGSPTESPTANTAAPTAIPTSSPTMLATTSAPTVAPTRGPTAAPSIASSNAPTDAIATAPPTIETIPAFASFSISPTPFPTASITPAPATSAPSKEIPRVILST